MNAPARSILAALAIGTFLVSGCAASGGAARSGAGSVPVRAASAPDPERTPRAQSGVASWYGGEHAGRRTASGERFDPGAMTAAHRTLPFGTRVRVTHLGNGRSVVVRINDRGPFRKARIVDLSRAAAAELRMIGSGVANVRLEVIGEVASD